MAPTWAAGDANPCGAHAVCLTLAAHAAGTALPSGTPWPPAASSPPCKPPTPAKAGGCSGATDWPLHTVLPLPDEWLSGLDGSSSRSAGGGGRQSGSTPRPNASWMSWHSVWMESASSCGCPVRCLTGISVPFVTDSVIVPSGDVHRAGTGSPKPVGASSRKTTSIGRIESRCRLLMTRYDSGPLRRFVQKPPPRQFLNDFSRCSGRALSCVTGSVSPSRMQCAQNLSWK
eukprot:7179692-Prymnesium_polylepis.1